jgi:hypothetical protein
MSDAFDERGVVVGSMVRYSSALGRHDDGNDYIVRAVGYIGGEPVAWLHGRAGCVSIFALTRITCEAKRVTPTEPTPSED